MIFRMKHGGDAASARRALLAELEERRSRMGKYNAEITLTAPNIATFAFDMLGRRFGGTVTVTATEIVLDAEVPLALRPLASTLAARAEQQIRARLGR